MTRTRALIVVLLVVAAPHLVAEPTLFMRKFTTDSAGNRHASAVFFNAVGQITPFAVKDVRITEGDKPARIISVKCQPPGPGTDVSAVLTIDVSGSMRFGGPNITLAKSAAEAWVAALEETSESAITSFDDGVLLQTDFTNDGDRLRSAINRLKPRGGTNYERAFLDSTMGGLATAQAGKHRRVMVFLTDGFGSTNPDSVVERAAAANTTIYCVTLGLNMPGVLKAIAERTGGLWFDNVTSVEQAVMAYQRIFADASGAGGCEIIWEPPVTCDPFVDVRTKVGIAEYQTSLPVPDQRRGGVEISSTSVRFDTAHKDPQVIKIAPRSAEATIRSFSLDPPGAFSIDAGTLPRTLKVGDTLTVKVSATRFDEDYVVGTLEVDAYPCPLPVTYLATGDPQARPQRPTLRVVHPNGTERFPVKSDTVLRWEGLPPDVPVKVEVSLDGGRTWDLITDKGLDLYRRWRVPQQVSDSCLLRVSHVKDRPPVTEPKFVLEGPMFTDVAFSPNGMQIVTASQAGFQGGTDQPPPAIIWDASNGKVAKKLGQAEHLLYSADGSRLLTWGRDSVSLYAMPTGDLLWGVPVKRLPAICVMDANVNQVVIGEGEGDRTMVVNGRTGAVITTLPRRGSEVGWVDISQDGRYIAVCEKDSVVTMFTNADTVRPRRLRGPGVAKFYRAEFSPDARQLATTDASGVTQLWDVATLQNPRSIATRYFRNDNTYLAFTPDGRRLAVETGRDETKIVDVATGSHVVSIRRMPETGGASGASILGDGTTLLLSTLSHANVFDAQTGVLLLRVPRGYGEPSAPVTGRRLAVITPSRQVHVYDYESPLLQQDVSDAYWAIYRPAASLRPLRFRERAVGQTVDSTIMDAITNVSKDSITIRGIRIEGAQAADFGINAPKEFRLAPGESMPITYSFHPRAVGERAALVVAETESGIINAAITGRCPGGVIAAGAGVRDLGTVPIGEPTLITVSDLVANQGLQVEEVNSVQVVDGSDPAIQIKNPLPFTLSPGAKQSFDVEVTAPSEGRYATQIEFSVKGLDDPVVATLFVRADSGARRKPIAADPTTFRSIMLPTAVVAPAGTSTTGVYDVLGLSAGYSVTNNVAILVGGALPLFNRWFGATGYDASWSAAWSVGGKVGFELNDDWIVGGGYQFGQSYYDQDYSPELESKITFNALWATGGYGDDDSRLNLYLGYAFKHHETLSDGEFQADATILGVAYDYRFARNWKVCAEAFFMRTMSFVPVTVTARYFREDDAFELGLSYVGISADGGGSSGLPVVPMLTWVKRW